MADQRETDAISDYRPVSPLAVAAAVLAAARPWRSSLGSLGAAAGGGGGGVAALADSRAGNGTKAGRLSALAGSRSPWGLAQAVTTAVVDGWITSPSRRAAARAWIEAVREGRSAEALGLCGPSFSSTARCRQTQPDRRRMRRSADSSARCRAVGRRLARCGRGTGGRPIGADGTWVVRGTWLLRWHRGEAAAGGGAEDAAVVALAGAAQVGGLADRPRSCCVRPSRE